MIILGGKLTNIGSYSKGIIVPKEYANSKRILYALFEEGDKIEFLKEKMKINPARIVFDDEK